MDVAVLLQDFIDVSADQFIHPVPQRRDFRESIHGVVSDYLALDGVVVVVILGMAGLGAPQSRRLVTGGRHSTSG